MYFYILSVLCFLVVSASEQHEHDPEHHRHLDSKHGSQDQHDSSHNSSHDGSHDGAHRKGITGLTGNPEESLKYDLGNLYGAENYKGFNIEQASNIKSDVLIENSNPTPTGHNSYPGNILESLKGKHLNANIENKEVVDGLLNKKIDHRFPHKHEFKENMNNKIIGNLNIAGLHKNKHFIPHCNSNAKCSPSHPCYTGYSVMNPHMYNHNPAILCPIHASVIGSDGVYHHIEEYFPGQFHLNCPMTNIGTDINNGINSLHQSYDMMSHIPRHIYEEHLHNNNNNKLYENYLPSIPSDLHGQVNNDDFKSHPYSNVESHGYHYLPINSVHKESTKNGPGSFEYGVIDGAHGRGANVNFPNNHKISGNLAGSIAGGSGGNLHNAHANLMDEKYITKPIIEEYIPSNPIQRIFENSETNTCDDRLKEFSKCGEDRTCIDILIQGNILNKVNEGERTCKAGCFCKAGYIKGPYGECISEEFCHNKNFNISWNQNCDTLNMEYISCSRDKTCYDIWYPTSVRKDPCTTGCFCKVGFVKNFQGTCISESHCAISEYNTTISCDMPNMEHKICGRDKTCNEVLFPESLRRDPCTTGCFCMDGFLKNSEGSCVPDTYCKLLKNFNHPWTEEHYNDEHDQADYSSPNIISITYGERRSANKVPEQ